MAVPPPARPFGPWLPRLREGKVRCITPDELQGWVIYEDERLFVVNKPGDFVCHPSKQGPWSSLVGAAREWLGLPAVHLIFRLDRETSGVVVFAKDPGTARKLQKAAQERRYGKKYLAILRGSLEHAESVQQPLGDDHEAVVAVKTRVVPEGEGAAAVTHFMPLAQGGEFTLALATTETGRKHQIRAHAEWLGYPLVGDKIYGGNPQLFLDFIEEGWSERLAAQLLLSRQALHCLEVDLTPAGEPHLFRAPLAPDMVSFCREKMALDLGKVLERL